MSIVVLVAIWIVIGLLIALLAGSIWKGERPYGEIADYVVSILLAILTGFLDWYLVADWFNFEGILKFAIAVLEPPFVSLLGLWLMRKVKS
jgi:uncharacterized membrane protein YeaQ/YmgE (transglycosylase-associated protein family)